MSLLSPDSLLLYLTPDKVQAVHLRGWRQRIVGLHQLQVDSGSSDNWQAVLDVTLRLVQTLQPHSVRVVLSDQLVRYFCFPWQPQLRDVAEELAFAKLTFEETYGAHSSAEWRMTFSNEPPGLARLTAAVPEGLIAGLQQGLAQAKVTLTSLRPQLVAAVQSFVKPLPKAGWVVSHELGRLTVAGWNDGGWHWVSSNRISSEVPTQLVAMLQREMVLAGAGPVAADKPTQVAICAPALATHNWQAPQGLLLTAWRMPAGILARFAQKATEPAMTEAKLNEFSHALLGVLS